MLHGGLVLAFTALAGIHVLLTWADLCALSLLAWNKVLGFVALVKHDAAIKRRPSTPVDHLLQPALALHIRYQCRVCPAEARQRMLQKKLTMLRRRKNCSNTHLHPGGMDSRLICILLVRLVHTCTHMSAYVHMDSRSANQAAVCKAFLRQQFVCWDKQTNWQF